MGETGIVSAPGAAAVEPLTCRAVAPVHLRPTAPLAERVLLPGDPGRALLIATALLEAPRMFNHHRGLWGYTGQAGDGEPLTVQATGMGGPSAAIVTEELIALGARRLVRVGTCGGLDGGLSLGDLVVARPALADDGASRALGAGTEVAGDPGLTEALAGAATRAGPVVSTDLFYAADAQADDAARSRWRAAGALAVEMEAATVFRVAALRGARAAAVCLVTDLLGGGDSRERMSPEALGAAAARLGAAGAAAL
jgi:DeoD family purine-nucleoside phosphorylase